MPFLEAYFRHTFQEQIISGNDFIDALLKSGLIQKSKNSLTQEVISSRITPVRPLHIYQQPDGRYAFQISYRVQVVISFIEKPFQADHLTFLTEEVPAVIVHYTGQLSRELILIERKFLIEPIESLRSTP